MRLACVADDLTGANDLAGRLAPALGPVWSAPGLWAPPGPCEAAVVSAETRFLGPEEAFHAAGRAWRWMLGRHGARLWFQKIDSTLRGNPGEEAAALLGATGTRWAAVLPAYPRAGRVTLGGAHFVFGRRLDRSEFFRDPLSPARAWRPASLFPRALSAHAPLRAVAGGPGALKRWLGLRLARGARFVTFDCVEDAHVRSIAKASLGLGCRAFVGASALAAPLAGAVRGGEPGPVALPPGGLPWLFLVGSLSATATAQWRMLRSAGAAVEVLPPGAALKGSWRLDEAGRARLKRSLSALGAAGLASLAAREDLAGLRALGRERRLAPQALAENALNAMAKAGLGLSSPLNRQGWMATGGHTLAVFMGLAGLRGAWIDGEAVPGVPYGRALGPGAACWIASKPGGFGTETTLTDVLKVFRRGTSWPV